MQADRATAGLGGAAVLVAVAFAPGKFSTREIIFLALAGLVLLVTFAPILPVLHQLPKVGAPGLSLALSFEPLDDGSTDLRVAHVRGVAESRVLRVGFINSGPRRVHHTLVNVLVPADVGIVGCNYRGSEGGRHGKPMPPTVLDGVPTNFWADPDVDFPVGAMLLHYRLDFSDVQALGSSFRLRVQYDSDDLYGGERVHDETVPVVERKAGKG